MKNAYKKIFEFYGARHQAKKLMEESAELIEALEDYVDNDSPANLYHVIEEIADCTVVSNQFALAYADNSKRLLEDIVTELSNEKPDETVTVSLARYVANIIECVAHYENTGKYKDKIMVYVQHYMVLLHRIRLIFDIGASAVREVMEAKIDRQLTRMERNQ